MKKFDLKSMCIGIITGSLLFGSIVGASTLITDNVYLSSHKVTVDGKEYKPTASVLNYSGTTYVPLREFGTITGSSVDFSNGTIIIKKPTTSTSTTTPSTGTTTKPTTSALNGKKISLEVGDSDSFYVDLNAYGSKTANVSITTGTAYASLSKTVLTKSGLVSVTGKKPGDVIIKVSYNNGYTDYINVEVESSSKSSEIDELDVEIDDEDGKFVYYIDLEEYDADKAKINLDDDDNCVKLSFTKTVTSSKSLVITGKDEGEAEIEIVYYDDDGDKIDSAYIYITVIADSDVDFDDYDYEDEIDIDYEDFEEFTVDPDDYDADWATISIISGTDYISVSDTFVDEETDIEVDGDEEGEAIIQVTYSTGDIEYYYFEVID